MVGPASAYHGYVLPQVESATSVTQSISLLSTQNRSCHSLRLLRRASKIKEKRSSLSSCRLFRQQLRHQLNFSSVILLSVEVACFSRSQTIGKRLSPGSLLLVFNAQSFGSVISRLSVPARRVGTGWGGGRFEGRGKVEGMDDRLVKPVSLLPTRS